MARFPIEQWVATAAKGEHFAYATTKDLDLHTSGRLKLAYALHQRGLVCLAQRRESDRTLTYLAIRTGKAA